MEPGLCSGTDVLGLVIDKRTVAFGDQEHTLDVGRHALREVVFQVDDARPGREIAHPEGMTGLFRGASRSPGDDGI